MPYTYTLPTSASFTGKGLLGYNFGPLRQDVDIFCVEVEKGHDTFMVSRKITRTYYVLSGSGYFTIDNRRYDVRPGTLVEVPAGVEYSYSGKMTLFAFARPRWFNGNDTHTRWNPDVVHRDSSYVIERPSLFTRLVRLSLLGKSPVRAYLRLNQRLWNFLPSSLTSLGPVPHYARFLHSLACIQAVRGQAFSTHFLRNRPQLELIRRLLEPRHTGETVRVAVLGCSTGAEAYSIAWKIRSARPDLKLMMSAVDVSKQALEVGKRGVYSLTASELAHTNLFDRMTAAEMVELFDSDGETVTVKSWIKDGFAWHVVDAGEREILDVLGPQDIVVANNFLCHMDDPEAERCLRNIGRLVRPGGYLLASGIDLEVRTKVARDSGWKAVEELLEEIHEGDGCMRSLWPCHYGGLEPLNRRRPDWRIRYAAAFQVPPVTTGAAACDENELAMVNGKP